MADAQRLKQGLSDYLNALDRQLALLREHGDRLDRSWAMTRAVYQGQGAEHFAEAFARAKAVLNAYQEAGETILPIMRGRLEALEQYDNPDSTLG
jgi:uncharacterized protein YukE